MFTILTALALIAILTAAGNRMSGPRHWSQGK